MSLRCSLENYFLFNGDSLGEGRLEWVCGLREEGGVYGEIYERSVREREMERERERVEEKTKGKRLFQFHVFHSFMLTFTPAKSIKIANAVL